MFRRGILKLLFVFAILSAVGQQQEVKTIDWRGVNQVRVTDYFTIDQLYFDGAVYTESMPDVPVFSDKMNFNGMGTSPAIRLVNTSFQRLEDDVSRVRGIELISDEIVINSTLSYERKTPYAVYSFVPLRKNPVSGQIEKLVSFSVELTESDNPAGRSELKRSYATSSVLASGRWYKMAVTNTGVHRISYQDLQNIGIDPSAVDPRNIRIYGNGGGMLPESLSKSRYDDLQENAIFIDGEQDGSFDPQDYILFYGESPHTWEYNDQGNYFFHLFNIYSYHTYYFITADLGPGKRIQAQQNLPGQANNVVTTFVDHKFHEIDTLNLAGTGRIWYGEIFDIYTSQTFSFEFPDIVQGAEAYFKAYVAAKSTTSSLFRFYANNQQIMTATVSGIPSTSETFARNFVGNTMFTPSGSDIEIRVDYAKSTSNSIGWLNYLELNVPRNLRFSGSQMSFRDPSSYGQGNVSEFRLSNAGNNVTIWNVTDPLNVRVITSSQNGQTKVFRIPNDSLQEFIAFNGNDFYSVSPQGPVPNQDLHNDPVPEMVIITHPDFTMEANRLANHHLNLDGMEVLVTEIQQVYNEFSSGAQDITAIRDYMKMLYDRSEPGNGLKYLLLFGDASYDYKDRVKNNSNYVPTWEDDESLTIVYSIATDDYYGFLDNGSDNLLDIGIGRFPVETVEQARIAVDKVIRYSGNSAEVMGEWRNYLSFVADDEDGNLHLNQAEQMCERMDTAYMQYNLDKIYVDAFRQISTPGGQRVPEVNEAINRRMEKGTLLMNYTGHGGELGWGHERFLEISDINSWTNFNKLPIFITATCEFSRYDDPVRLSAGEMVFRNPEGGAVGMFTTARATFGGSNFNLNQAMFDYMFEKVDGEYPRFGDLIRLAKNRNGVGDNDQKFILLGDPAMRLAYPEYKVETTRVNEKNVSLKSDTLKALDKVTIEGEVRYPNGTLAENFNGELSTQVFDKPVIVTTFAEDPSSYAREVEMQKSILYKGKAKVKNGKFSFTFIVPKDIAYQFGRGKVSYYANDEQLDGSGYFNKIIIGGFNENVDPDDNGPEIRLFMNDENFAFGGITDENPMLVAHVNDENGINTVGNGIGHDIVAILDDNTDKPFVLNEYYEADLDSYKSGTIRYPLSELEEGPHSLSLKVWDVYNNSSTEYIEFVVAREANLSIDHVLNYPNPFTTHTDFFFEHNQPNAPLEVQVQVFTISGKLVKTIDLLAFNTGFRSDPIPWDGTDDFGDRLAKGVYLYKIRVRNDKGEYAEKLEKLVILK